MQTCVLQIGVDPGEFRGMLRTDEAMIKALHAYSFHWADRGRWVKPLTQDVIGMNIKITDGREKKEGNVYREQSKRKANYAVVSEGSDRCLDAFVSVSSRASTSNMMQTLTFQVLYSS